MRRLLRIGLCALCAWSFFSGTAQTHTAAFEFRRISLKNGLVNQVISSVCLGKKGELWIGTQNGLYTYDGSRIIRYDDPLDYRRQLPDQHVTDLQIADDASGLIFVCTPNGTCAIDPELWENVPPEQLGLQEDALKNCVQLEKSRSGFFFAYTPGNMYRIIPLGKRRFEMQFWYKVPLGLLSKMIADPTQPDACWMLPQESEIWHVSPAVKRRHSVPPDRNNIPKSKGLVHLSHTKAGIIAWDMAWNFYMFDPALQEWRLSEQVLPDFFPAFDDIESAQNQKLMLYSHLDLEAAQQALCTNLGLFVVRPKNTAFKRVPALQNKEIQGIHTDSSGNWWASTYNGMFQGNLHHDSIRYFPQIKGVWSFLAAGADSCLMAFEMENSIGKWDFKSEKIQKSTIITKKMLEAGAYHTLSLCRDFRGIVWAGTYLELLHNTAAQPGIFECFRNPVDGEKFEKPIIRSIVADQDSSLWIGAENGLYHLVYNHALQRYESDPAAPYVKGVIVSALYLDRFGNLWLATKGKGLGCRSKTGHWQWLDQEKGLINNVTCRIEGSHGDRVLWISSHHGLSRYEVATGRFFNYYEENGLPSNEYNAGSSAHFSNGALAFGALNGLVYFYPDSVQAVHYPYKTIISAVKAYDSSKDTLRSFQTGSGSLSLWPYPEYVEILLGSNEFVQPNSVSYRYRMIGISDNWNVTHGEHEVKYFKLPPGNYTFEVQVKLPDGHFGTPSTLFIHIPTPFYKSWWVLALFLLKFLAAAYLIYRSRINQVLKEQAIRRQIADDLHDDIGNKLNIISILTQKVMHASPENAPALPGSPLQKLLGVSREALMSLHTMIWTVDPTKDRIRDLLVRMEDFAEDYLLPLNISCVFRLPVHIPEREINLKLRHHLILIYQEVLTNMVKHTTPTQLTVRIALAENGRLEIEFLNDHSGQHPIFSTVSANRGRDSMKRRLNRIQGSLEQQQISDKRQKTTLVVFNVYKN